MMGHARHGSHFTAYIRLEDVSAYEKLGWKPNYSLLHDHHGQWAIIMYWLKDDKPQRPNEK